MKLAVSLQAIFLIRTRKRIFGSKLIETVTPRLPLSPFSSSSSSSDFMLSPSYSLFSPYIHLVSATIHPLIFYIHVHCFPSFFTLSFPLLPPHFLLCLDLSSLTSFLFSSHPFLSPLSFLPYWLYFIIPSSLIFPPFLILVHVIRFFFSPPSTVLHEDILPEGAVKTFILQWN